MTRRALPPYPSGSRDWREWGLRLLEFLQDRDRGEAEQLPEAVQLLHQNANRLERAVPDGILMWDPIRQQVVYSDDGIWKVFGSTGSLSYLVTDDAGSGDVADDINNTDFTGQVGSVGTCAQCPVGTDVSFFHKGVQYVYAGPTPASYGLGCADTMQVSYLIPTGAGRFTGLTDTPSSYGGAAGKWPRVNPGETALIFDDAYTKGEIDAQQAVQDDKISVNAANIDINANNITLRARWRGTWSETPTYEANDMVLDYPYLSIANKQTQDRPAPRDVGDPVDVYTGTSPTAVLDNARTLLVLNTYTLPEPLRITQTRVYTVAGNYYTLYVRNDDTGQVTEIANFVADDTGWRKFATSGALLPAGTVFSVGAYVTEPDPTPTQYVLSYNYTTPNNTGVPAAGNIIHANRAATEFRVNKTGQGGQDNSAALADMEPGDTIDDGTIRWAIQSVTDNGTWINFGVAPTTQGVDGIRDFTFETVTPTPITTVVDPDYYLGNANVQPSYQVDGGTTFLTDDGYGVDITYQQVDISEDWDVMAISGTGGAAPDDPGGGGGASVTTGPIFPDSPAVGDLHYMTEEPVGLYLFYDDGNSQQWVQTNGGGLGTEAVTIAEDDPSVGYQVIGDILIQFFRVFVSGNQTVNYPLPFKAGIIPEVVGTSELAAGAGASTATIWDINSTSCVCNVRRVDVNGSSSANVSFIAIGEAPDDMKKDKTVGVVGGGADIQEFHDPNGEMSWRIIGNTLELFGTQLTDGSAQITLTFPKTFARTPTITANTRIPPNPSRPELAVSIRNWDETGCQFVARRMNSSSGGDGLTNQPVGFHIIGEWDGVS